jgi:hypothetical protein
MKDIERIAKLEIQVENLLKNDELKTESIRKLKVALYQAKKQARFFLWLGKAWKNVCIFMVFVSLYFCIVDMLFSTEKFHSWFFQKAVPWAVHRIID